MRFVLPPIQKNYAGKMRRVGFEIEYSGLTPIETAAIVIKHVGGTLFRKNEYEVKILHSRYGDFSIYLDSVYFRSDQKEYLFKDTGFFKDLAFTLSELVVPYELVTPPIPMNALEDMETIKEEMRKAGALGTDASILYAFGLHINTETFSLQAKDILDVLRSFVLLEDWIKDKSGVDLTRKLSWFIEPFDKEYIELILKPDYAPNNEQFINDYIFYNPTRNRALDLLPLLSFIDPDVSKKIPPQKLTPRPAFHYRLPNCKIDDPSWSIAQEFNYWSLVESIACDHEKLADLMEEYHTFQESPLWFLKELWIERVQKWIQKSS